MDQLKKWISRKLFVAVGGVLVALLLQLAGPDQAGAAQQVVDILVAYIYGQSAVDLVRESGLGVALKAKLTK